MINGINVLSLFDGCSGGQQALDRLDIKVDNYYASEIDKYAIQVTIANYPNTIQLGSVVDVDVTKLEKIDLLCGGSPCQSFSFAGKRKGMSTKDSIEILTLKHYLDLKSQNFEFEGQSYLFWEYMRILTDIRKVNPDVKFLLENVMMGEKWQKILTQAIGINPIEINSSLVSAQNRRRLYWTNIGAEQEGLFGDLVCKIPQPKDMGILLKDVLEDEVENKYYLSDKLIAGFERHKERHDNKGTGFGFKPKKESDKGNALRANASICPTYNMIEIKHKYHNEIQKSLSNEKSTTLDAIYYKGFGVRSGACRQVVSDCLNENQLKKFNENVDTDKHNTLTLAQGRAGSSSEYMDSVSKIAKIQGKIRRLTPLECERLQCIKDNYTAHVSDTQRYKMIGNGWTISVISYIFSSLKA